MQGAPVAHVVNHKQANPSATPRRNRRGVLAWAGRARLRWLAFGILAGSKLPAVLAFALAAFNLAADHEVRFEFGDERMEVTLHHSNLVGGKVNMAPHQHNLVERALIGKPASDGEPDHHFGVARAPSVTEEEQLRRSQLDDPASSPCFGTDIPFSHPHAVELTCTHKVPAVSRMAQTPQALRRGVMMLV